MYGLDYVALRYFNVYGPRMDIHGVYTEVLVRWMERIEAGEPPLILGDGSQTMDFVARGRRRPGQHPGRGPTPCDGEVFNVGQRRVQTSLAELAAALTRVMESEQLAPVHGPERATNAVHSRLADIAKAREQLGLRGRGRPRGRTADLVDLVAGVAGHRSWLDRPSAPIAVAGR